MRRHVLKVAAILAVTITAPSAAPLLPIAFEEARPGPNPAFLARAGGYRLLLARHEVWMASRDGRVLRIRLVGSRGRAPSGVHRLIARSNYIRGLDPARWRTGIANFQSVTYRRIYPGIDLLWRGNSGQVEHDFLLAPWADPRRIRLRLQGALPQLTPDGDLAAGGFVFRAPHAYQEGREIPCRYDLRGRDVRFALGPYDRSLPLTIDPILSFSTYLAGSHSDSAAGIALDRAGNMYVAGTTASSDFPSTAGVVQPKATGDACPAPFGLFVPCTDIFVTKLSGDGATLLFSTYLGGNGNDAANALAVDSGGNVYLLGSTSGLIPKLAPLPGQMAANFYGLFVAKLSADGSSLLYATWVPYAAKAAAIAVDAAGALYLTGTASSGLPVVNAFQSAPSDTSLFKTADAGNHWQGITGGGLPVKDASMLAVDPSNPQLLYIGLWGTGLLKSTDAGAHWNAINNGLDPSATPMALAVDPRSSQTLYLDTLGAASQVYKSADGGATWAVSGNGISGVIRGLAVDPNLSTVYAVTSNGLFKSADGASTWSLTGLTADSVTVVLDPSRPATIYAGTSTGLMKSTDAGVTWTTIGAGLPPNALTLSLAIDPVNPQTLYTASIGPSYIFKSTDGGAHWTQLSASFAPAAVDHLLVDPVVHTRVWAGTSESVMVSLDSGATWTPTPSPFPHIPTVGLAIDATGNLYAAGCCFGGDAFVAKLDSTGSQIVYSTYLGGLGADHGSAIAVDAAGRAYVAGQTDSPDFPLLSAVQPRIGGDYDAFVTVLDPTGARLAWSTYFGSSGAEQPPSLAIDAAANVHLAGTVGPANTYAAKLKSDGSAILYSTQLGGTLAAGVAADTAGNSYVAGTTSATGLPTPNGVQPALAGVSDAFVTALDGKTGAVQYATYLGGSAADYANGIAADSGGSVYLAGTTSSLDFPLKYSLNTAPGCTTPTSGCFLSHVFVAKLAAPGNGPALRLDAVTNAASYGATLAPGELVAIWGADLAVAPATAAQPPLPTQLSDVRVAVNGVAAPLIYASASQVNAQIPFETPVGAAQVQITSGAGAAAKSVTIAGAAPAIFTLNASGAGPGAIQHATTYQVVTDANPAAAGEIISIYCTGLGAVTRPAQTGAAPPGPSSTVASAQVSIGGIAAPVFYAGVAPGFAGLYQVNAQVPAGTPSGAQPLQIVQNGVASNLVTVAIQ